MNKEVITTYNASGAVKAASLGYALLIVDVIDMSTSLEAAIQGGAFLTLGASPDKTKAPVQVNPYKIGLFAGQEANEKGKEIIIISEPRWGSPEERMANCNSLLAGIKDGKGKVGAVIPNIGAETGKITDFTDKIVICVSDTGGVAFDAAWQIHNRITTGTIARTLFAKSQFSVNTAVERIIKLAQGESIAVVAASSNSLEDVLAANYFARKIIEEGYLNRK